MNEMNHELPKEQKLQNVLIEKVRYTACAGFFRRMKDVSYAVVKGETLSLHCYGETGCRRSCDIDILIAAKDVDRVGMLLKEEGFSQKSVGETDRERRINKIFCLTRTHQTLPFEKRVGIYNVEIDINFNVLWGDKKENEIDMEEFLQDTVEISVYGQKIKALSLEKAFIQTCLHHYKELNSIYLIISKKRINLNMYKEIDYFLLNNRESLSPQMILEVSEKYHIRKYIYYMIFYAQKVTHDDFLNAYVSMLYSQEGKMLLDKYGLSEETRKTWKYPFEVLVECEDLSTLMEEELTEEDKKKIEMDLSVFGRMT